MAESETSSTAPAQPTRAPRRTTAWPREAPQFQQFGEPWHPEHDIEALEPLQKITADQLGVWLDRFKQARIHADRRNSPDLLSQLGQALVRPVDTVLCTVLDVDPGACLNTALAARFPIELAAGVVLIARLTGVVEGATIVTDARVPSGWLNRLRVACRATTLTCTPIINDYPQADPTLMLYSMLGRRLRPGRLPTEQQVIVLDAAAAIAVGRCALSNIAMAECPISVRDHELDQSHYVLTPAGSQLGQVMDRLSLSTVGRIIRCGDVLRDMRVVPDHRIAGGELVFHSAFSSPSIMPSACVRCGWCVDACPTRVYPATVLEAAQRDDPDLAEDAGIEACIECGICSYVCSSQLPLLQSIRAMRSRAP